MPPREDYLDPLPDMDETVLSSDMVSVIDRHSPLWGRYQKVQALQATTPLSTPIIESVYYQLALPDLPGASPLPAEYSGDEGTSATPPSAGMFDDPGPPLEDVDESYFQRDIQDNDPDAKYYLNFASTSESE
jgi:hypothetical protein